MKISMIQQAPSNKNANKPNFTAKLTLRGNTDCLNIDELRDIIMECRSIGTIQDQIDIALPNLTQINKGSIPMAGYINKSLKAFYAKFNGSVYEGIMNGLRYAKNSLFRNELRCIAEREAELADKMKKNLLISDSEWVAIKGPQIRHISADELYDEFLFSLNG